MSQARVNAALAALRRGEFVVVADDRDREDEGDLILAAEHMTPDKLAFLLRHTSGIVCVAITKSRARALALPLMVEQNEETHRTQFTVSVDARGTGTGISATARSSTIVALAQPESEPSTFLRPGHVFPLIARSGGVLERPGHTEAAVDLVRLAGLEPAGALCELMADDGSMLSGLALEQFAAAHGLAFLQVADLVNHRRASERAPVAPRACESRLGSAP